MIQVFNVFKNYDPLSPALIDISLHIRKGEFVFISGPSGAGKTTLLKLIYRAELPTRGQILVNRRNIVKLPSSKIPYLRRSMGIVFQDFKLLNNKTIFDNVSFVLKILGVPTAITKKKVFNMLRMVDIHQKMKSFPPQLSGGEQQRVAIARALINDPVILLADEPTGNLDPELSMEIMHLFEEANQQGTTVVIATHNPSLIESIRNRRVIVLDRGRIVKYY